MKHGQGQQYYLRKKYEDKRRRILLSRYKYTEEEQLEHDVSFPQGGGRTNPDRVYIFDSCPFPVDSPAKEVDKRKVPWLGISD